MFKTSYCSCSLKPGHFKLSGIETSPPNVWMIELTCLIPVMCFSNCCSCLVLMAVRTAEVGGKILP